MNWFWLTIIYVIFMTFATLINKKSVNNDKIDEIVFGACVQLATALFSLFLALITGWNFNFNSDSLPLFIGMGITYFFAVSLYFSGIKRIDISLTAILESSGSVYALILGILLLNESVTNDKIIGVLLIAIAVLVVSVKNKISSINKYSFIILCAIFFYALGAVFDKKLNTFGNPLTYLSLSFATAGTSMLLVFLKRTKEALTKTFKYKEFWIGIVTNGILYSFGFWALFEAYNSGGEVSKMFPITMSMSVLVPTLGIIFLGEKDNIYKKILAMIFAILGVWFLGK